MGSHSPFHLLPNALALHFSRRPRVYLPVGTISAILLFVLFLLLLPPAGFPSGETITIEEGASFRETALMLEERHVVNSALALRLLARVGDADERVMAGEYVFPRPSGLTTVLHHIVHGETGIPSEMVTFPEGSTARDMAAVLKAKLPGFDSERFLALAREKEGRLFPDTYHLTKDMVPEDVIALLEGTFKAKMLGLADKLASSPRTESDVIIMASLIEREARTAEDRRMISGILWERVDQGLALQVDAVFGYIHGTDTYHPSFEDLEVDSPYNTYRYPGLPPGAISNPGIDALEAALMPTKSEYLYYLTGTDGQMRYARTFEEHKENRALYLD